LFFYQFQKTMTILKFMFFVSNTVEKHYNCFSFRIVDKIGQGLFKNKLLRMRDQLSQVHCKEVKIQEWHIPTIKDTRTLRD